jgi:hypothetical protein
VDSTEVTEIRDDPQNHGIEFAELNASLKQLESSPSDDGLKHAARVLWAVGEKLLAMSQALQSHDQPTEERKLEPLPDKAHLCASREFLFVYGCRGRA